MISFTSEQRYYIYPGPMNMRKDIGGLAGVVQEDTKKLNNPMTKSGNDHAQNG